MTVSTDTVRQTAREALLLIQSLNDAAEIQWEPSHTPKPREDTSQRASGGHGDPTGDIVLDARRLALRDAVTDAEATLRRYAAELMAARVNVDRAVARWNGE